MSRRYALADYLTPLLRTRILTGDYRHCSPDTAYPQRHVDDYGSCPLGRLLLEYRLPSREAVTAQLVSYLRVCDRHVSEDSVFEAVDEFITDWDEGRLQPADLAVAIGASHA